MQIEANPYRRRYLVNEKAGELDKKRSGRRNVGSKDDKSSPNKEVDGCTMEKFVGKDIAGDFEIDALRLDIFDIFR